MSASGIAARSAALKGAPSSSVNAKRPPGASAAATARTSAPLSANASIVSSSSTTSKLPGGSGGTAATANRHGNPSARERAIATALALASTPR